MRSFWRVSKSATVVIDEDGNEQPAFANSVAYYETARSVYLMADVWERADIERAGGTRQDLNRATELGRYVRDLVRHADDSVGLVRSADILTEDVVLEPDVPAVLFSGDTPDDVVGPDALAVMARG